jgi:hypothetical protein
MRVRDCGAPAIFYRDTAFQKGEGLSFAKRRSPVVDVEVTPLAPRGTRH